MVRSSFHTADVDVKLIQSGVVTIAGELNLELQLILRDGLAAHDAGRTGARPAPSTVRSPVWQLSSADRFLGFRAQDSLVGHGSSVGAASTRYGSETVVLSPFEMITKVPAVVSPV